MINNNLSNLFIKHSLTFLLCCTIVFGGCSKTFQHKPVPKELTSQVSLTGFDSNIRFFGDKIQTQDLSYKNTQHPTKSKSDKKTLNYLAISSGGENGAFAAGLLYGWTYKGDRPQFDIVTGVSTGSIIAVYAFLGKAYDQDLKKIYTNYTYKDVIETGTIQLVRGVLWDTSIASNKPFVKNIKQFINQDMLNKIAEEHQKGRRLFISTTNLESEKSVIWDIGLLANSNNPKKLDIFHKIILASTAIPGGLPPVFFDVSFDGKRYTEMHVDGGLTGQVFFHPHLIPDHHKNHNYQKNLYIIANKKLHSKYRKIKPWTLYISYYALATLMKNQHISDLYKLYTISKLNGLNYHHVSIPEDFNKQSYYLFDSKYTSSLFSKGVRLGNKKNIWNKKPHQLKIMKN